MQFCSYGVIAFHYMQRIKTLYILQYMDLQLINISILNCTFVWRPTSVKIKVSNKLDLSIFSLRKTHISPNSCCMFLQRCSWSLIVKNQYFVERLIHCLKHSIFAFANYRIIETLNMYTFFFPSLYIDPNFKWRSVDNHKP